MRILLKMQENDKDVGKENDDLHQATDFQAQTFHLQMPTMRGRYYDVVYVWNGNIWTSFAPQNFRKVHGMAMAFGSI